jgi:predicted permease
LNDCRLAVRTLRATPIVSAVAVLSLALGIGANTAIFSLVNSLLFRALPVTDPQRLVSISSDMAVRLGFKAGVGWSYAMWNRFRPRAEPFDGTFAWSLQRFNLAQGGEAQPVDGVVASGDFFTTLGVGALAGRTFTAADDVPGGGPDGPVAVISYGLWQRRYGGSSGVIGTPLVVEHVPFTIIGVTPPDFFGVEVGRTFDVALPLATEPLIRGKRGVVDQPRSFTLFVMLRLKSNQSLEAATAALRAMQPQILGPADVPRLMREPFTLVPAGAGTDIPGSVRPRYERPLLTLFGVVALVLIIACANIANLLLARATTRRHELSVRRALGAPRGRLVRQLLIESLVLAGIGAAVGLVFAVWGSRELVAQLSTPINRVVLDASIDSRVLAFTVVITVATAVLFGTAPAFRATSVAPIDALKGQGRGVSVATRGGLSSGLVVGQLALSLVLVVAAGLLIRTFERLASVSLGFDGDRVLVIDVETARAQVDPEQRVAFYHRLVAACAAVPGVAHAAASTSTPVSAWRTMSIDVAGAPPSSPLEVLANSITPGWFAAYGTALRAGRDIDARDTADALPVAVVNEAFARRFFPARGAIGETIASRTVVGIVADQVVQSGYKADGAVRSVRDTAPPTVFMPLAQSARVGLPDKTDVSISVRSAAGSPALLARSAAAALAAVDRNLAFTFRPLSDDLRASLAQDRLVAMLAGFFGALALLLAGLGLYGVTAYSVSQRRTEIGIRMALGAAPGGVVRLVLSRVARLVGAGVIIGIAVSVWLSKFIQTLLFGIAPGDPLTLSVASATLVAIGALAGWFPAWRAASVDPAEVLKDS